MKNSLYKTLFLSAALLAGVTACNKSEMTAGKMPLPPSDEPGLITFTADGALETSVETKVSAVTTLSSFYVSATKGSAGSETSSWNSVSFSGSSSFTGGKYWPSSNPSYHFYAANDALTFAAAGTTVAPDGSKDVVVAYLASPTYKSSNALTFSHVYARVGTVTISPASGSLSNVSATLKNVATGGTYNLRTDSWTAGTKSDKTLTVGSNDLYVVPGTYTLTVTYTATLGDYTETFTKSGSVTLQQGKVNSITATAPNSAAGITFTVSVTAWGSATAAAGTLS